MANVKITELVELAAVDLADNDVLPIVDVGSDATKKVTIVSLRSFASANDYVTFTSLSANIDAVQSNVNSAEANIIAYAAAANANLSATYIAVNANINAVQSNVDAAEANIIAYAAAANANLLATYISLTSNINAAEANIAYLETRRSDNTFYTYNTHSVVSTANIIPSTNNILSLGAPNAVYKDVYVGPGTVYIGSVRLSDTDGALTITSADDSTSTVDTQTANVTAALNTVQGNVAAAEANIIAYAAISNASLSSTYLATQANDYVTYTRLTANINVVQNNVAAGVTEATAVETRRAANIAGAVSTITTGNLTASKALVSDESGKIAASSVTTVTLGYLDATSSVQSQIDAKAPLASPTFSGLVTAGHDLVVTGNLTVNGETTTINSENKVIQDRFIMLANAVTGSPSGDVGIFLNRGTSGNAAIYYDESAKSFTLSETRDPDTNVTIHPTGAANLVVGAFSASTISFNGVDLNTAITDNVASLTTATTAVETRRAANVTIQDTATTAVETRRAANVTIQDTATTAVETRRAANVTIQDTATTAVEARRTANIAGAISTITTGNLTASKALVSDGSGKVAASSVTSTVLGYLDATSSVQTQLNSKIATTDSASNDYITYTAALANDYVTYTALDTATTAVETRRAANVTIQDTATTAVETRRAANVTIQDTATTAVEARRTANIAGAISTITTGNLTASKALVSDGSGKVAASSVTSTVLGYLDATSSVQTQLNTKISTTDSASNDYITYTQLTANINLVQDNVVTSSGGATAVEARRVANIAGAVSTITTDNLTVDRALVSDGSGKVAASTITTTVLGYLDATSSVQTQLNSKIATTDSASNDYITYTAALANDYVTYTTLDTATVAVETRRAANVTIQDTATTAVETRRAANVTIQDTATTAVEARRTANIAGAISTITTGNLTASKALVSDGSGKVAASSVTSTVLGYLDATSSVQTQLNSKIATTDSASNDYITYTAALANDYVTYTALDTATTAVETRRAANVTIQDTATTAVETRRAANVTIQDTATTAVEARRAANIAGAISTVTTGNLSTARALVSDESGKIAASSVTTVTLGYLDATSSIQNQLNTKAPLADPTFTGLVTASHDLVVSGNLTVNGETTTINSANKVIQDRFIMLANAVSGAPSGDVGIFLNRGTSGNAAIYYDESAKSFTLSETRDPDTNVTIHPTGAANLVVGAFSASTISFNGVDLNTAITDNVASLATATTAVETRRAANIAGAVSTITTGNLTASRALLSDGAGKVAASTITSTVLGYLDATSSVQTQLNSKQATITGGATTIDTENLTVSRALVSDGSGKVAVSAVTATEVGYLDGVSSAIQTQLNSKQATITGGATTIDTENLTVSRALVSDASGKVAVSAVTATEVGYLDGVSSAIQTQIDSKQASLAGATLDLGVLS
jgi:predicted glycosyl hydrolase (DUF1957 family)